MGRRAPGRGRKERRCSMTTTTQLSPAAQALIEQIHADAVAETLTQLSARDGVVVLHSIDRDKAWFEFRSNGMIYRDPAGNSMEAFFRREEPEQWRANYYMRGVWHPAIWEVSLDRVDQNGREWRCRLGFHVIDDFGTLVPVERGAQ